MMAETKKGRAYSILAGLFYLLPAFYQIPIIFQYYHNSSPLISLVSRVALFLVYILFAASILTGQKNSLLVVSPFLDFVRGVAFAIVYAFSYGVNLFTLADSLWHLARLCTAILLLFVCVPRLSVKKEFVRFTWFLPALLYLIADVMNYVEYPYGINGLGLLIDGSLILAFLFVGLWCRAQVIPSVKNHSPLLESPFSAVQID